MKKLDFSIESIGRKLFISFVIASIFNILFTEFNFNDKHFADHISLGKTLIIIITSFLVLMKYSKNKKYLKIEPFLMIGLTLMFLFVINTKYENFYFSLASILIMSFIVFKYYPKIDFKISDKKTKILYIIFGLLFISFISYTLILNYLRFLSTNFDFGIFSQVYYNMTKTGISYATSVRDYVTTQLHIHFSPILYLILPIYYIFPSPITLLVMQGVLVALGLIPLYKLCKHYKLNNFYTVIIGLIFIFHPSIIGGNLYYFHENNFLVPLILWLLYYIEKNNYKMTIVFAFLTCFVKEDAPIFVVIIGLYYMFFKDKRKIGLGLIFGGLIYFFTVILFLRHFGDGVMNYRYSFFIDEHDSLIKLVINVIKNPGYLLKVISDYERFVYLVYILVPLGLIPLSLKKKRQLILYIPLLIICLMSSHRHQYEIIFHYGFGPTTLFFYLLIVNFKEIKKETRDKLLITGFSSALIFFASIYFLEFKNLSLYLNEKDKITILNKAVNMIPEENSVKATTFLVPQLSQRKYVYEFEPGDMHQDLLTDYIVMDLRFKDLIVEDEFKDYEIIYEEPDIVRVYKREGAKT